MLKKYVALAALVLCSPVYAVDCSTVKTLEDPSNNWLNSNDWMGPNQITTGISGVKFTVNLGVGRKARIERIFYCQGKSDWGPESRERFVTNARSIIVDVTGDNTAATTPTTFRIWDKQGHYREWRLGVITGAKHFELALPEPSGLSINSEPGSRGSIIGGFHFELDRSAEGNSWAQLPSKTINLTINKLVFSPSLPSGTAPIQPQPLVTLAPITQAIASGSYGPSNRPVHFVLQANNVSYLLQMSSTCGKKELAEVVTERPLSSARCVADDIKAALAYAKLAYARACPDNRPFCKAELVFGVDGIRWKNIDDGNGTSHEEQRTTAELKAIWPRVRLRIDGVTAGLKAAGIPFYFAIGNGHGFDVRQPGRDLGEDFLDSPYAKGFWLGETVTEGKQEIDHSLFDIPEKPTLIDGQQVLSNVLDFTGRRRDSKGVIRTDAKVVVHHRMSNAWWIQDLFPERMQIFDKQPPDKTATLKNHGEVYVPAWEMLEPSSLSVNLATALGYWAGGWVNEFGVSTQSWGWENMRWGGTHDMRAQDWLRMWTIGLGTGANYIQVEPMWAFAGSCTLNEAEKTPFANTGVLLEDCCANETEKTRGITLKGCEPDEVENLKSNINALQVFHNWVEAGVVIAADKPANLKTLNGPALQIHDLNHYDFDSVRIPNRHPAPGTIFSKADLDTFPGWLQNSIKELTSSCFNGDAVTCAAELAQNGDHTSALLNISGTDHKDRSRILPAVDIFGRIHGNSHVYDGVFPQTALGLIPIIGVPTDLTPTPPSGLSRVPFSGADIAICPGGTGSNWCGSVQNSSDLIIQRLEQNAKNLTLVANGGGATLIRTDTGRYVAYLYDAEQRFPKGADIQLELRGPELANWMIFDSVTGEQLTDWNVTGSWSSYNNRWYWSASKRTGTVKVAPGGVRILNILLPPVSVTPPSLTTPWQTALLAGTSSISDGSSYAGTTVPIPDWDPLNYKGTCANRSYVMTGLSFATGNHSMHKQLCTYAPNIGTQAAVLTGLGDRARFQRTGSWSGTDWDPHFYKWQCGQNEYISGVSQTPSLAAVHAVRCSTGFGQATGCEVKRAISGDDRSNLLSGDWDSGFHKAECSAKKVVVGLSISPSTLKVNGLLCCDQ